MVKRKTQSMYKPRQYFCEMDVFTKKYGKPKADQVVTKVFNGKKMEGAMITKEEDEGLWAVEEGEHQGVEIEQRAYEHELRNGQGEETYQALANRMEQGASSGQIPEDGPVVLVSRMSSAGIDDSQTTVSSAFDLVPLSSGRLIRCNGMFTAKLSEVD